MTVLHMLTGEYPPGSGGVGDYAQLVAAALAARGCAVHVWCPALPASNGTGSVRLHRLPDDFGAASRRALASALEHGGGTLLLQYVPNALGRHGANLAFCAWMLRMGRRHDVRVMFHEPYFYFAWQRPGRNVLAAVQRVMAALLLRGASVVYFSTETWRRYLAPWTPAATRITIAPIPSTIPSRAGAGAIARWRATFAAGGSAAVIGHFGTYGDHVASELRRIVPLILDRDPSLRFAFLGRGSQRGAAELEAAHPACAGRITATGPLPADEVAAALRACDLALQPYPDGVTTRRTSVMAALASGVATVSSAGALTEPIWIRSGAVEMARAGDDEAMTAVVLALLRDDRGRAALAERGQRVYEAEFSLARTVDALLDEPHAVGGA